MQDKCSIPIQTVHKICCCSMLSSIPFLTFQRLGLVSNPVHGLDKSPSPNQTNTKFSFNSFMASLVLHTFLNLVTVLILIATRSNPHRVLQSNSLWLCQLVQLSSQKEATRLGTFQRSKCQK